MFVLFLKLNTRFWLNFRKSKVSIPCLLITTTMVLRCCIYFLLFSLCLFQSGHVEGVCCRCIDCTDDVIMLASRSGSLALSSEMHLTWFIEDATSSLPDRIVFYLELSLDAWVGIGWHAITDTKHVQMESADFLIAQMTNGKVCVCTKQTLDNTTSPSCQSLLLSSLPSFTFSVNCWRLSY